MGSVSVLWLGAGGTFCRSWSGAFAVRLHTSVDGSQQKQKTGCGGGRGRVGGQGNSQPASFLEMACGKTTGPSHAWLVILCVAPHPAGQARTLGTSRVFWQGNAYGHGVGTPPRMLKIGRSIFFFGWRRGAVAKSSAPFLSVLCLGSALFACLVFAMFVWSVSAFVVVDCFLLIVFCFCLWYRFDLEWVPSGFPVN